MINEIYADKLFGHIQFKASKDNFFENKFLYIYSENGMGKTTLLGLIYALVSCGNNEGNKNFLYKIDFKEVSISFEDGSKISALRQGGIVSGPYKLLLHDSNGVLLTSADISQNSEGRISHSTSPGLAEFLVANREVSPDIVYLKADRSWQKYDQGLTRRDPRVRRSASGTLLRGETIPTLQKLQSENLQFLLNEFRSSIFEQLLESQAVGLRSSETIFERVISEISRNQDASKVTKTDVLSQIEELKELSKNTFKYGLSDDSQFDKIIAMFSKIGTGQWRRVQDVAALYVETARQRFESLANTADSLDELINDLNSYFITKKALYSRQDGLSFYDLANEKPIDAEKLSSGERQLITLFAVLGIKRRKSTLFLIDEPEISLSPVWQRKLTNSFERMAENSENSYLIATHSLELLSDKLDYVVQPISEKF